MGRRIQMAMAGRCAAAKHRWLGWPPRLQRCIVAPALVAALSFASTIFAAAPPVSATIEPAVVAVGESALLTITTLGNGMESPNLPRVPNLDFHIVQQSRRTEIIRGATMSTSTVVVRITPRVPGIYTIPGMTPSSQPLILRVNADEAAGNPHPAKIPGAGGSTGIVMAAEGAAFARMLVPKTEVYVGEGVPVSIEVGMRANEVTSVNGLPTLEGSAFTLNNLSRKPERIEKIIDGSRFAVLTWHSVLAAIKPGALTLTVGVPLTVRIQKRPQKESQLEDQLGDPFLQNIFGASVQKEVQIASPPLQMMVLALPAGRPADFSGAVGEFKIDSSLSATTAAVGDPLTLRMTVVGSGNFDRVDSAMLAHVDQWRTYPPTSHFTPGDPIGHQGEKRFEQPIIALQPGTLTLPGLAFNYFDPTTRHYETARSEPINVTVTPAAGTPLTAVAAVEPAQGQNAAPIGLRSDHAVYGQSANSLVPLYLRPTFVAVSGLLGVAFAGGWLALRRRTPHAQTGVPRARRSKSVDRELERMQAAARAGDAMAFLHAAQAALTLRAAGRPLQATEREEIHQLSALAEEARYSGRTPAAMDFARWTRVVRDYCAAGMVLVAIILSSWQARAESPPTGMAAEQVSAPLGQSAPRSGTLSAAALYNLANAYARQGRTGMAVLNYERARLLAPNDADIDANLTAVRQAARLTDEPRSRFAFLGSMAAPTLLAWLSIAGLLIVGMAVLAARLWPRRRWILGAAALLGMAPVGLTVCNAVLVWPVLREGVVVTANASARVAPAPLGDPLFVLADGDTVRMTAKHEGFFLVQTSKGQTGWVSQANVAAVVPRD
jgi:tetratricopeptide (TPR) repeat protein